MPNRPGDRRPNRKLRPRPRKRNRRQLKGNPIPVVLVPVLLVFAVFIGYFSYDAYATLVIHYWAKDRYRSTQGTIRESKLLETPGDSGPDYDARVVYAYSVDGRDFRSERRTFGGIHVAMGKTDAEKILASYPAKKVVTVYYDPADPSQAVLDIEPSGMRWGIAAMMAPFTAFGGFMVYLAMKRLFYRRPAPSRWDGPVDPNAYATDTADPAGQDSRSDTDPPPADPTAW